MTRRTGGGRVSSGQSKAGSRMIEISRSPIRGCMALRAIVTEVLCLVIGICRSLICGLMTAITVGRRAAGIAGSVARPTTDTGMSAGQSK